MLSRFFEKISLSSREYAILDSVGISTAEDLLSLVYHFPSLGRVGLDLAKLSNFALQKQQC